MTTAAPSRSVPSADASRYSTPVRRARTLLQGLLLAMVVAGVIATAISFFAVQDTLQRYRAIVDDSAYSADAAQAAREALLAHHSAAADFLSLLDTPDGAPAARQRAESAWQTYQEAVRRLWQNRSDEQFGEFAVFTAGDSATLRYRAAVDAMFAFVEAGDREAGEASFLESNDILVREVVPALNGLESVKLESMEDAYATTASAIRRWQQGLLLVGGGAVTLLLLALLITRFWLHYAWTWELGVATLVGVLLFVWFNVTLLRATNDVEILVRQAYDTVSGIQSVAALLTQAEALESMAIFNPEGAQNFLSDADEYLFLLEQQLCGEPQPHCTDTPFMGGGQITQGALEIATEGQGKYGLPRAPLVASAASNRFAGEAEALEALRLAIQRYRQANEQLDASVGAGQPAQAGQRTASEAAYAESLAAAAQVRDIARGTFDRIYRQVTTTMELNRWLALLFTALGLLGYRGLRRRREALFP